jgi:alpha-tubulin suppressor-like RCC1 family protein
MKNICIASALAVVLSACGGSLVDHLGVTVTGTLPDGGGCTGASCNPTCSCDNIANAQSACASGNQCVYTCDGGYVACGSACCLPQAIAAGGDSTCAIVEDSAAVSKVVCWGATLGGSGSSNRPTLVPGLSGVTLLAVGGGHACAATADGVHCWGSNDSGQLGQPSTSVAASTTPLAAVPGISGTVSSLALGTKHSCAVTENGAFCWGNAGNDRLSTGSSTSGTVQVPNSAGASRISAGDEDSCIVSAAGAPVCWGSNDDGQIGSTSASNPEPAPNHPASLSGGGASTAIAIASGLDHNCVVSDKNTVHCWGRGDSGQLGDEGNLNKPTPDKVAIANVTKIAAGASHTCAYSTAPGGGAEGDPGGGLFCWGSNTFFQFGSNGASSANVPTAAAAFPVAVSVVDALAAGSNHTCALGTTAAGQDVFCWGKNDKGQAGVESGQQNVGAPTLAAKVLP